MNKGYLAMIIRHEINEQEMVDIFDEFAGSIIDGYPCEELTEYLHEAVRELAVDQAAEISKGDFTYILEDFISSFIFDDKNGGYVFKYEDTCLDMECYGNTKVIRTIDMNDERTMAYRTMWKVLYRAVREEDKANKDALSPVHLADIVLMFIMYEDVNPLHIRNMITRALSICSRESYPFPTLADMRRSELEDIANGIEPIGCDCEIDCQCDEIPF